MSVFDPTLHNPTFRATEGTRLIEVGGRPLLFVPQKQSVFSVVPEATRLWQFFEAGIASDALVAVAACHGIDGGRIADDLAAAGAIEQLSSDRTGLEVFSRTTLVLADVDVSVSFGGRRGHELLTPALAHLAASAPGGEAQLLVFERRDRVGIARRNGPIRWWPWKQSAPALKTALAETVLERTAGLALHAGSLVRDGSMLLVVGPPGAGKSTLSVGLEAVGWAMEGDDIAILSPDGAVRALPFAATVKQGAWPVLSMHRGDLYASPAFVRPDGKRVRYLPPLTPPSRAARRVRWIVVLNRVEGPAPRVMPLDPADTLAALLEGAASRDGLLSTAGFEALAACVEGAQGLMLTYSSLDEAVALVEENCPSGCRSWRPQAAPEPFARSLV